MSNETRDRVQFLEDRIIVDYGLLRRIYGLPDEPSRTEILYSAISKLELEPEIEDGGEWAAYQRLEPIPVERVGKTIVFHLRKVVERIVEPAEEFLEGPFLVAEHSQVQIESGAR